MNPRAMIDLYPQVSRWRWFVAAIVYGIFVIYGSLVPLHYQPLDWDTAVRKFRQIPFLQLDIGHRADWVANILLFIPLNFLWCGVLMRRSQGIGTRLAIAAVLVVLSCGFAVCIEFTQQWFPPRTVSQNDIVAESIGAVVGCVLWFLCGFAVQEWLSTTKQQAVAAGPFERALLLYVIGLAIYSVMPLDLTISVSEIYRKFREGKVELAPTLPNLRTFNEWYGLITDVIVFIPVGVYVSLVARRRMQYGTVPNVLITAGIALLIELAQVLVYSRFSSVNDVITGTLGGAIGVVLVRMFATKTATPFDFVNDRAWTGAAPFFAMLTVSAIYAFGLCCFFWWPIEPLHDRAEILARLKQFWQVPFKNYYYGTEFHALTGLLRKTLLLVPLGYLLGVTVARSGAMGTLRRVLQLCSLLALLALAVGIEAGQALFPGHYPDVTDSLIYIGGGLTGLMLHAKFTGGATRTMGRQNPRAGTTLLHSTRR